MLISQSYDNNAKLQPKVTCGIFLGKSEQVKTQKTALADLEHFKSNDHCNLKVARVFYFQTFVFIPKLIVNSPKKFPV